MERDRTGRAEREPHVIRTDGLSAAVVAELESAFEDGRTVEFSGEYWIVQKLEEHVDPGAGESVTTFELIPADAPDEEGGDFDGEDVYEDLYDEDDLGDDTLGDNERYDEG